MSYAVEFTQGAEDDLMRLYDYLLNRAETLEELDVADEAVKVIRQAALSHLSTPAIIADTFDARPCRSRNRPKGTGIELLKPLSRLTFSPIILPSRARRSGAAGSLGP